MTAYIQRQIRSVKYLSTESSKRLTPGRWHHHAPTPQTHTPPPLYIHAHAHTMRSTLECQLSILDVVVKNKLPKWKKKKDRESAQSVNSPDKRCSLVVYCTNMNQSPAIVQVTWQQSKHEYHKNVHRQGFTCCSIFMTIGGACFNRSYRHHSFTFVQLSRQLAAYGFPLI